MGIPAQRPFKVRVLAYQHWWEVGSFCKEVGSSCSFCTQRLGSEHVSAKIDLLPPFSLVVSHCFHPACSSSPPVSSKETMTEGLQIHDSQLDSLPFLGQFQFPNKHMR